MDIKKSLKYKVVLFFQTLLFASTSANEPSETLECAVFGLGGRVQILLMECIKLKEQTGKTLHIAAVCDNHGKESYDFFIKNKLPPEFLDEYTRLFQGTTFYPDSEEGIKALLSHHTHLDRIFITSSNDRHLTHFQEVLNHSDCKSIFIEKPLFRTIEEFSKFNHPLSNRNIQVGLTLRSAKITQLVAEHFKMYKSELGRLQKVNAWEHVNFGHGLSIIMMNWRRYISLSGGLLLDKSIHDLDLACFFMEAAGVDPQSISISTEVRHDFYKKSNKEWITQKLLKDNDVRKNVERWDKVPWQRLIPFSYHSEGVINWRATMDNFFSEFPENDDFMGSDIIPDTHNIASKIETSTGEIVDFCLEVKLNGFSAQTERGSLFTFENGTVEIDLEDSKMRLQIKDRAPLEINLKTRNTRHAGGDTFVAHGILGTLPSDKLSAQFLDPSVQLSSIIGLVSEYQALKDIKKPIEIKKVNDQWVIP